MTDLKPDGRGFFYSNLSSVICKVYEEINGQEWAESAIVLPQSAWMI